MTLLYQRHWACGQLDASMQPGALVVLHSRSPHRHSRPRITQTEPSCTRDLVGNSQRHAAMYGIGSAPQPFCCRSVARRKWGVRKCANEQEWLVTGRLRETEVRLESEGCEDARMRGWDRCSVYLSVHVDPFQARSSCILWVRRHLRVRCMSELHRTRRT